jgi:hypothetical protein
MSKPRPCHKGMPTTPEDGIVMPMNDIDTPKKICKELKHYPD